MDDDTLPHHEYIVRTNHTTRHMFAMLSLAILEPPLGMWEWRGSQACFCEGIHSYNPPSFTPYTIRPCLHPRAMVHIPYALCAMNGRTNC